MKIKIILLITFILCCSGCYNYNELNTLAIIAGMSIDYKDDEYVVNVLIANSKQAQVSSKEGESQSIVYEGKGKTLSTALKEIEVISPKSLYIGHLSFIVVSEDLAKEGLQDTMDFLIREPASTKRFYLILAKNVEAKNVLQIVSPLESFPSQSISIAISFSKESQAVTSDIPYSSFVEKLLETGAEPILPSIEIEGSIEEGKSEESLKETTPKSYLKLSTLALFKGDRFVHFTDEEESDGINIINGDSKEMLIECNCSGGKASIELRNIDTNYKIKLENNQPVVTIKVDAAGAIQESTCLLNLESTQIISDLEKKANEEVQRLMDKAINVSQKFETDIFGFGNLLYKYHPSYFKSIKKTWNEEGFKNLKIKKEVSISLETKGSIESRIKEK